jgi:alanyl-tRNA synthetase
MRNHTGTHLLHAALRQVLGDKVHQSGSAEALVNHYIADEYPVIKRVKTLEQAKADGAMALFGEKYGSEVRTIEIADQRGRVSYELCGGTHLDNTAKIGSFYITSESSVAAGIRRIEAVTGERAYAWARERLNLLNEAAAFLETSPFELLTKAALLESKLKNLDKELEILRAQGAQTEFSKKLQNIQQVAGVHVLSAIIPNADADALRSLTDQFRQQYPSGVVVLGTVSRDKPMLIAAVTPDLIARGIKAGDLIKRVAAVVGGGGGGRPDMAQAGGKDPDKLSEALDQVAVFIRENLK